MNHSHISKFLKIIFSAALCITIGGVSQAGTSFGPKKVVVVGVSSDPGHFNPAITTGKNVHVIADSMFNGLVALDRELSPIPDLAESWTVDKDSKVYTFKLVQNALWHDGTPFTSADVKFTFENILLKYHSRTRSGLGSVIESIDTPDAHTVIFRMKKPYGPLLQRLDVTEAPILPKHIFLTGGDPNKHSANLKPIGTGPFMLDSYKRGDMITLKRNPNYFKPGLPKLDRLVFRVIPDSSSQLIAMEKGEIDLLGRIPGKDIARLQKKGGFTLDGSSTGPGGGNCIVTWTFNLDNKNLQNIKVRKAIAYATDRTRIVDQVLFGWGKVPKAPISSAITWAHSPESLSEYDYNTSKAIELLESAGLTKNSDGIRLELDVVHFPSFGKYAEVLKQDMTKIGIDLVSRPLDRAAAISTIFKKRKFDTNIISYCNGLDPDIGVKRMYVTSNIKPIPFSNGAGYSNPRIDKLFNVAGETNDLNIRSKHYKEIQQILSQELPYWWLAEITFVTGYNDSLKDFRVWTGQFAEYADYK